MEKMRKLLCVVCLALVSAVGITAQRDCGLWLNEIPLVADTAAGRIYATIDPEITQALRGTFRWDGNRYGSILLNGVPIENGIMNNLYVQDWSMNASNTLTVVNSENRQWTLLFSTLPFILIDCPLKTMIRNYAISKDNENHYRKYPGYMSVIDARFRTKYKDSDIQGMACFSSEIGIRLRGQTSGSQPKNSFNVELVKDGESQDVHLLGYRKDDDWLLGAEYTDYSRMRNRVLMDLWNSVDDLPYEKDNEYQGNGTQGEFVEVFMNGAYYGMYCFSDKIDRKKLNLKKTKEATETTPEVKRGMLWKATWECSEAYLSSYKEWPANDSFLWPLIESKGAYGWEQKYPDDSISQAFFDPLCYFMDFQNSSEFKTNWTDKLYPDNVTDFMIFMQVFALMDNQKKNYYFSVRNWEKEQKYLFTIWDLDGSIGRKAGGSPSNMEDLKQMAWGEKLGYHHTVHVFKTLKLRPEGYATIMNDRWQYLSTHQLSLNNIRARMERYANLFVISGAWEREKERWVSTYKKEVKITDTPQEEVEYMMSFLKANYAIFDSEMAKERWAHDEYDEYRYTESMTPEALYVIGNDITSKHEDNTVILQGSIDREPVDGIDHVDFENGLMTIAREDEDRQYDIEDIKEVRMSKQGLYSIPAFVPDSLKRFFDFETRFNPVNDGYVEIYDTLFDVQRTVYVAFKEGEAYVNGNLNGITATVTGDSVHLSTAIEGVALIVSGSSPTGKICIDSSNPFRLSAGNGGTMLSAIDANCDLVINTSYSLNFYNSEFDGKCINTSGTVTFVGGNLYFLVTASGTLTDASFGKNPTLGARAVMASNIVIEGGNIFIKSTGHHGAVGLAAAKNVTINGGNRYIATYDDPIKAGSNIEINGGFTFTSSLTNDGMDSKGNIHVYGGIISTCGPEGAEAAFDVNHFYCHGGTVIGVGFKGERPIPDKSRQASFRLNRSKGVEKYVKLLDAYGNQIALIETPAYPVMTIIYSSPELVRGDTYTILTGSNPDSFQELTTITAE